MIVIGISVPFCLYIIFTMFELDIKIYGMWTTPKKEFGEYFLVNVTL